jgi:GNAT superfamily N-acetyltransferase
MIPAGYLLRRRIESDDAMLIEVEKRAAGLFRQHGYPQIADEPVATLAELRALTAGQSVWVATRETGKPVGFAIAGPLGRFFHLRELSIDPAHGRRGLGAALVGAVIAAAEEAGCDGVSLTTFRSVPFNKPFYQRLGFAELAPDVVPRALKEQFERELPPGIAPDERILMVYMTRAG